MRYFLKNKTILGLVLGGALLFTIIIYFEFYSIKTPELYLKQHSSVITLNHNVDNNKYEDFKILNSSLNNNQFFLTSYTEIDEKSMNMNLELFKYFVTKGNVKYYLNHMPYSCSCILNRYLQTGDEDYLDLCIKFNTNIEEKFIMDKWKDIYEFNNNLSQDKKIKILGLGKENYESSFYVIESLINDKKIPEEIKNLVYNIKLISDFYVDPNRQELVPSNLRNLINEIDKELEQNEEIFKEFLGEDFLEFYFLAKFLKSDVVDSRYDDTDMYKKFSKLYAVLQQEKYFGSFRGYSSFQNKIKGQDTLGRNLKNVDSTSPQKIVTIAYVQSEHNSKIITNISKDNTVIFKLTGYDSPFQKYLLKNIFPSICTEMEYGSLDDYFQYAIKLN